MKKQNFFTTFLIILIFISVGFYFFYQKNKPQKFLEIQPKQKEATMVNPASQNCLDKGGQLEIKKNKNGEYGICIFEDNYQCEEWALFRGDCPIGGVKITGYNSDQEIYCAISGNIVEDNKCILKNNSSCSLYDFYNQNCPQNTKN